MRSNLNCLQYHPPYVCKCRYWNRPPKGHTIVRDAIQIRHSLGQFISVAATFIDIVASLFDFFPLSKSLVSWRPRSPTVNGRLPSYSPDYFFDTARGAAHSLKRNANFNKALMQNPLQAAVCACNVTGHEPQKSHG